MEKDILVFIFLRGGMDGLNVVVPYGDTYYPGLRPTIGIPNPQSGETGAALDLDGYFGLHPALAPLLPYYQAGSLAVVHAVGLPDATHSHFSAQDNLERGVLTNPSITTGWLNRHLASLKENQPGALRAVSFGTMLPASLRGPEAAIALTSIQDFHLAARLPDQAVYQQTLESLYAQAVTGQAASFARTLQASAVEVRQVEDIFSKLNPAIAAAPSQAAYPADEFGKELHQIAQLIKTGVGLDVACLDVGGWDTHANEVGQYGVLAKLLATLGQGLAAFASELDKDFQRTLVLITSEFGRRAHENGSLGTDHGHGNAMLLLGGSVAGGKVYGKWPTLAPETLYGPGDLAVTTDCRDVFSEAIRLRLGNSDLASVFPGYTPQPVGVIRPG